MRYFYLFIILLCSLSSNFIIGQQFVNQSNEWFTDDCCYSQGQINCETFKYWFDESVLIDSTIYYQLNSNNSNPLFEFGGFYREEGGMVFMKLNENEEEFIIYDFNLVEGDQLEIGNSSLSLLIEVLAVDSITLISGEKRKRLEVANALDLDFKHYWIEGIGSESATMNPLYMFTFDCWNELNCYHFEDVMEYQLGDCELTSLSKLSYSDNLYVSYPNPVLNQLIVSAKGNEKIVVIEIFDVNGKSKIIKESMESQILDLSELTVGIYFLKVQLTNRKVGISKFIKK